MRYFMTNRVRSTSRRSLSCEYASGKVSPMSLRRLVSVFALLVASTRAASGQVTWTQRVGDKAVWCTSSGLSSTVNDCGYRANWYTFVFVGSISSIAPAENNEMEVRIIPEEVFSGDPGPGLTVLTSEGLCLPKLVVGDRWLFYLRRIAGKPIVLDFYGNDSSPIASASEQINTLRRLQTLGDFAILRGRVIRGSFEGKPVRNAHVTASRESDEKQFQAVTNADGRYEFPPLPPGEYKIRVGSIGTYKPDNSEVNLKAGACVDLTMDRSPHARISGHVSNSNGSPMANVDVALIRSDNSGYQTTQTDSSGNFNFDSQQSGKFVVGVNYPPRPDWFNGSGAGVGVKLPPVSTFYPSVTSRSSARIIRLGTDQRIDNVDFIVSMP
jgi:5-hydroxyisourate hydrolase-like protein (transthyretin family)